MAQITPSRMQQMLKLDYSQKGNIWLSNQTTLRKLVGILGMMLPVLLYLFVVIAADYYAPLESISHYYYTRVAGIFVIIMGLLAIFLLIYKGDHIRDFFVSTLAGIFALCVILFPTSNLHVPGPVHENLVVTVLNKSEFRQNFHLFSAAAFLACLAYMSLFRFTLPNNKPACTKSRKGTRNGIYRACGFVMIAAMLVIVAGFFKIINEDWYDRNHLTFWMETLAVESFGVSWLIKGESFFKDVA